MLKASQKQQIVRYLQPYNPTMIGVFGSYARGEEHPNSDLDILVKFKNPINLLDFIGLEIELSELLGIKVDLVSDSAVLPTIRPYIEKDLLKLL